MAKNAKELHQKNHLKNDILSTDNYMGLCGPFNSISDKGGGFSDIGV